MIFDQGQGETSSTGLGGSAPGVSDNWQWGPEAELFPGTKAQAKDQGKPPHPTAQDIVILVLDPGQFNMSIVFVILSVLSQILMLRLLEAMA